MSNVKLDTSAPEGSILVLNLRVLDPRKPNTLGDRYFGFELQVYAQDRQDGTGRSLYSHPYRDLLIHCQGNEDGRSERTLYGYNCYAGGAHMDPHGRMGLTDLEAMVAVMRKLDRAHRTVIERDGDCRSFGHHVLRLAKHLGISYGYYETEPRTFRRTGIERMVAYIDSLTRAWQAGEYAAARQGYAA